LRAVVENFVQRKLYERFARRRRQEALEAHPKIIEAAERVQTLNEISCLKKLKAEGNYFRIRVGEYRIGLVLDGETLIFVRCLNRRDVYRYFP